MKVKTFILGPLQTSSYVAYNSTNAIIIDAGGEPEIMVKFIKQKQLNPIYLVNTHGHIDHIMGNPQIKKAFPNIKLLIHPADAPMLRESKYNLSTELGFEFSSPEADQLVKEDDVISLPDEKKTNKSNGRFKVIHLPGHTKGGIGLWYQETDSGGKKIEASLLFSGDAIFAGSIGRTDFPGGSHEDLIKNIKEKIFSLPDDTVIFPGHGPMTTVGAEKESNPFF